MENCIHEMEKLMAEYRPLLESAEESLTGIRPSPEDWSLKEIIGHLIDSASNNHQRFVRLQLGRELNFPDYDKDEWLGVEHHNSFDYGELCGLFVSYNQLILHLIRTVDEKSMGNRWNIPWGEKDFITLEELMRHYVEHLKIHFGHFGRRLAEVRALEA